MPPPPPVPPRESSYELNKDDELVPTEMPPLPERRPQSYISDLSKTTRNLTASQNDSRLDRAARSRSPQKGLASGPRLASVPEPETIHVLQQASMTVASCDLDRKQNYLTQDPRKAAEHKHKDESDDLSIILSHPLHLQLQSDLEDARIKCKKLEDGLLEKSAELAKRESELTERESELAEARKGWRKVAGELNKIRTKGQGFYQVTDQYLIDKTNSLRYSIRNFAIQYFEGEMERDVQIKATRYFGLYIQPTTPDSTAYQEFFRSPKRCPSLIQGILWRVLYGTIFNQFHWAGGDGDHVYHLCKTLRPKEGSKDFRPDPQAERKFQTWSATTTSLLMDAVDLNEGGDAYEKLEKRKLLIHDNIYEEIEPFTRHIDEGFGQEILKILGDAIVLDKEICKQAARVIWVFEDGGFDPSSMVLEGGEKPQKGSREVQLVVAPGLKKRGKSTGEDFKLENMLLRTEVSCEPVQSPAGQGIFRRIFA